MKKIMSGFICVSIDKAIKQTLHHMNNALRRKDELKSPKELVSSMDAMRELVMSIEAITRQIQHYRLVITWKESKKPEVRAWVKRFNEWLHELDSLLQEASGMAQQCTMPTQQGIFRDERSEKMTGLSSKIVKHLNSLSSSIDIVNRRTEGIVANARHITPGWQTVTASSATTAYFSSGWQEVGNILAPSTSSATISISQAGHDTLATARMKLIDENFIVGQNKALEELEKWVMKDEKTNIGVHGKAGSGKTLLLKSLFNSEKVRTHFRSNGFLLWLTVSKSPCYKSLRNKLWTQIVIQDNVETVKNINEQHVEIWIAVQNNVDRIKIDNEEEVKNGANDALQRSEGFVLILDDVWNGDANNLLEQLGLLQIVNNESYSKVKVIVSSRDPETLSIMGIADEHKMQIRDLNEHDSWKLFARHAFPNNDRNPQEKEQGKFVCHMCRGLPLAIKVVGRAMADSTQAKQWRWALQRLSNTESVYDCRLKFSFEALGNEGVKMQCCFLLAAAASLEDEILFARHVILLWAGEGLLSGKMTQEDSYDPFEMGWIYLNVLADRCLIEPMMRDHEGRVVCFRIHDELHNLAIQIAKEEENFYGPMDGKLEVLKADECSSCTRIFLRNKDLRSLDQSFRAPKIRSLFISENRRLDKLPERAIGSMTSLKFLDLSDTKVQSLPKSLSYLTQLVCLRLLWTPIKILPASLTTLVNLEILDLSFSTIRELPSDLHKLRSLRYLGLSHCKELQYLPRGISQLTSLQYLYMNECDSLWKSTESWGNRKQVARISDLVGLTQVKWLEVQNNGAAIDENIDEKSQEKVIQWETLRLTLTGIKSLPIIMTRMEKLKRLALKCPDLNKMEFIGIRNKKFDDFQSLSYLILFECGMLWKLPDLHKLKNLQRLEIITCRKLKEFPEEFAKTGAFPSLKIFSLIRLEKLEKLPDIEEGAMPALQIFTIMECPALKKLPPRYLQLKTLQKVRIYSCPLIAEDWEKNEKAKKDKMVKIMSIRDTEEIKKWHFQLCAKHGSWIYGEFWCHELFLFLGGLNAFV